MKTTLKTLLFKFIAIMFLLSALYGTEEIKGQRLSRDLNVDLLINQVGYMPSAGKKIVTKGKTNGKFEIIDLETQTVVFTGFLHLVPAILEITQSVISANLRGQDIII